MQSFTIPELPAGERIGNWKPLFVAAVAHLTAQGDKYEKIAVSLLPAYVNRCIAERELCRELVLSVDKVEEAFQILLTLDPPIDKYASMRTLCRKDWQPGTSIDDYFYILKKLAEESSVDLLFVCNLLVVQLPKSMQSTAKELIAVSVKLDNGVMKDSESRKLLATIKVSLVERGLSLTLGNRENLSAVPTELYPGNNLEVDNAKTVNYVENRSGHTERKTPWTKDFSTNRAFSPKGDCFVCGSKSHFMRNCPNKRCQRCGQKGHEMRTCNIKPNGRHVANLSIFLENESSAMITAKIGSTSLLALLDSGAGPSVIGSNTLSSICDKGYIKTDGASKIFAVGKTEMSVEGTINLMVDIGCGSPCYQNFTVLNTMEHTLILGRDFMRKYKQVTFDWEGLRVQLGNTWITTESGLELMMLGGDKSKVGMLSRLGVARYQQGNTKVEGLCDFDIKQTEEEGLNDLDINPKLAPEQFYELSVLLQRFTDVFADNPNRPNRTHLAVHNIDTGNARPVEQRNQRLSPATEMEINRQVNEMLDNNICRPSSSAWSSRVILVKKKDGSQRFVIDYRDVNDVTKKDAYPMPCVEDILDRMHGCNYFSIMDGASAYWCVELDEESKDKTAFSIPRGQYELNVMSY